MQGIKRKSWSHRYIEEKSIAILELEIKTSTRKNLLFSYAGEFTSY